MGGILRELRASLLAVNGMPDHTHLLTRYPADLSHADMLRHEKSRSSKWIHEEFPALRAFAWQEGYGEFTVRKSEVPEVETYIARQEEHHRNQDFKAEYLGLLRLHEVEFDEREVFE